jgi:hypothetical protein
MEEVGCYPSIFKSYDRCSDLTTLRQNQRLKEHNLDKVIRKNIANLYNDIIEFEKEETDNLTNYTSTLFDLVEKLVEGYDYNLLLQDISLDIDLDKQIFKLNLDVYYEQDEIEQRIRIDHDLKSNEGKFEIIGHRSRVKITEKKYKAEVIEKESYSWWKVELI